MRVLLTTLVPLVALANGLLVLALNVRRWRRPEQETPTGTRVRRGATGVFLGLLLLLVLLLVAVAGVSLWRISD